jgi:hypothetical protein
MLPIWSWVPQQEGFDLDGDGKTAVAKDSCQRSNRHVPICIACLVHDSVAPMMKVEKGIGESQREPRGICSNILNEKRSGKQNETIGRRNNSNNNTNGTA